MSFLSEHSSISELEVSIVDEMVSEEPLHDEQANVKQDQATQTEANEVQEVGVQTEPSVNHSVAVQCDAVEIVAEKQVKPSEVRPKCIPNGLW